MAKTKTQEATEVAHKIREIFEGIREVIDNYEAAEDYKNPDLVVEVIATAIDQYNKL